MRRLLPLALVSSVLLMCGCGGSGDKDGADAPDSSESSAAANGEKKTFRIAVIPKGTSHDFWLSVRHGAETAAKELGNVEVIWKGTQKEDNKEGQIQILDSFIVQGVDGICLARAAIGRITHAVAGAVVGGSPRTGVALGDRGIQ